MKKKLFSLAMVCLLTLGLSITSLAGSVEAGVVGGIDNVTDKDGNDITEYGIMLTGLTDEGRRVAEGLKDPEKLKELLESLGIEYKDDMYIIDMKEIVEVGEVPSSSYPITIKFNVKGVTASTKVIVLHYDYVSGTWVAVECTVGDGTVSAKFSSAGPVVFVVDGSYNSANGSDTTSTGTTSSTTSPTTGQTNNTMWAFAIVALGIAGTIALKKRA